MQSARLLWISPKTLLQGLLNIELCRCELVVAQS
jgi:hypothetical protein